MAEVLLAVVRGPGDFNKLVVLKSMRPSLVADPDLRQMFLAEARLSARLNHANVVQVYEVLDQAHPCIVMEYLDGQSMSVVQKAAGEKLTTAMQLRVISEVLAGLHYSHELRDYDGQPLNLVHRDVSPQNVFLTYDGQVKVLDFGIAKIERAPGQTRTGVIKGKIGYMPPEQLLGEHLDRRADIHAVGCMLWQAAAGSSLWEGKREGDIIRCLLDGQIPPPSSRRPVDEQLEALVMKALAPEPSQRHASALELQTALEQYLADQSTFRGTRDVGAFVAELFAEQRAQRATIIHQALSVRSSPPASGVAADVPTRRPGAVRKALAPTSQAKLLRPRPWLLVLVAVAAPLVVGGALASYLLATGGPNVDNRSTPPARAVRLFLSVQPRDVRLTLDGEPVEENPATLEVPVDGSVHEIRAERDGYYPLTRRVRFDRDLTFETVLRKQPSALLPPPSAVVSATERPRVARTSLPAGPRPSISVDTAPPASGQRDDRRTSPTANPDCDPPFYLEDGIKLYKPGCL